ncbi:16758_t:CDS:2 [Gigaspora margarita]|uniref:16758_t:CDS:1 n=1 Tax=Gigaspora margarita TaxID=4874 RepID=A0ABM8VX89_GIGMA|nr:16758_t:CDS:2 [Gigaspora margarita]
MKFNLYDKDQEGWDEDEKNQLRPHDDLVENLGEPKVIDKDHQGQIVEVSISNTSNNDLQAPGPEHVDVESDSGDTFDKFTYKKEVLDEIEG